MHPFKAIGLKLISALLFAAMSALVRQLGDVAPIGQMVFFRSAFAILPVMLVYGFLQGAWPFGVVEAIWAGVAAWRWRARRTDPG